MRADIQINGYPIERLCKNNLNDLDKLHNTVYRRPHPANYFVKKYDTAYTGVEWVGFIAYNEKHSPIAYYGVVPCFVKHGEQLYLAAQSADTMTHPRYQYKGLFVHLANLTFDLCEEEGISIVFGFPNQNSLHSFLIKLKWQMTETMVCYIIPVGIIPLERIAKKLPFLKNAYKKYLQYILKDYLIPLKGIENSVFKDGFAGLDRNAHYFNYKAYNDTQVIKIGRSLLWIKIKNGFVIGDISCTEEDFDQTMNEVRKLALKLGVKQIKFHTSHQTQLSSLFSERYDSIPSFYVLFKDLGTHIPLDKIKFTFADTDIF